MSTMVAAAGPVDFSRPAITASGTRLWYLAPASRWLEALPTGNGPLGAWPSASDLHTGS